MIVLFTTVEDWCACFYYDPVLPDDVTAASLTGVLASCRLGVHDVEKLTYLHSLGTQPVEP